MSLSHMCPVIGSYAGIWLTVSEESKHMRFNDEQTRRAQRQHARFLFSPYYRDVYHQCD